jgi:hypothetical protein
VLLEFLDYRRGDRSVLGGFPSYDHGCLGADGDRRTAAAAIE